MKSQLDPIARIKSNDGVIKGNPLDYIMRIRSEDGGIEWNPLIIESFLKEVHTRLGSWQPIETAPKDGTLIMLGREKQKPYVGSYERTYQSYEWRGFCNDCGGWSCVFKPTHWMPLPKPPKED